MQKWQYDVIEMDFREAHTNEGLDDRRKLLAALDQSGSDGWELVNAQIVGGLTYLFLKTPVVELGNAQEKPVARSLWSLFRRS
ncbi:hypothetical protein D9M72_633320 [compost metagenome]